MNKFTEPKIRMDNAIVINTRIVEAWRRFTGSWQLTEKELDLCDKIAWEITLLLPEKVRLNPISAVAADKILSWIESGDYRDGLTNHLPDESEIYSRKARRQNRLWRISLGIFFGAVLFIIWYFI